MTQLDGGHDHNDGDGDTHLRRGGMTNPDYWDLTWEAIRLPQILSFEHHVQRRWDDLFRRYLAVLRGASVVEVGCAPGSWLIYFHDRWGLNATGIESSPVGAALTRRNGEITKTPLRVIEQDLFDESLNDQFDVVWSGGLVEHFEDLAVPLARLRELVAPGGLLITSVPNLHGSLYAWMTRRTNPDVLRLHRVVAPSDLSIAYRDLGLAVEEVGYFGTWNLEVVNFGTHRRVQVWANRIDRGVGRVLGAMRARGESRWLSPYVVAVGRAPTTGSADTAMG